MADTGWKSPGTVSQGGGGQVSWSNLDNIKASDNTYATCGLPSTDGWADQLEAYNFGFSIPSNARIDGVEVQIERKASSANKCRDGEVRLIKADGTYGTANRADISTYYPTTDAVASYGGATDMWGETLTESVVEDVDFGVMLYVYLSQYENCSVDHIQMKVYYTENTTPIVGEKYPLPAFRRV